MPTYRIRRSDMSRVGIGIAEEVCEADGRKGVVVGIACRVELDHVHADGCGSVGFDATELVEAEGSAETSPSDVSKVERRMLMVWMLQ